MYRKSARAGIRVKAAHQKETNMRCDIIGPTGATLLLLSAACLPLTPLGAQAAAPAPASPQAAPAPFVKAEAEAVVRELATQLEDNFVFPDVAKKYAEMLRANLAAGKYASFADAKAFADKVTEDLQAVHKDGHLRLHVVPAEARSGPQGARRGPPPTLNAISKSGWLADGVAYIRFEGFPGTEATLAALKAFIDKHASAKTLIIDARTHRGGGLSEMDVLFPQLFDKPTVLVGMDTRVAVDQRRGPPEEPSVRKVAGPDGVVRREHFVIPAAQPAGLAKAKVYLLTSNRTGSAGEHLSLALKRTHRATLIGETTRGMGHYGGMVPLGHGYAAFIPVGRTFDPDTNQGWEGTGVKPDVEVPADKALDEALRRAGVNATGDVALAKLR
jgi:hypothetical protein